MISQIGSYHIIQLVGEGSMGAVYLAMSSQSEVVAIKVVSKRFSEDKSYLQRFMREISVAQHLKHPNIVQTLDFGVDTEEDMLFAVMEFVDGPSVNDLILRFESLPIYESLVILAQTAKALDYARKQQIVHRDIKPANLLLNKKGVLKIADFGLVKDHHHDSITETGTIVGSPAYMSPEQILGEKNIDIRSDVYSLGVVFYKMLTGHLPYFSKRSSDIIMMHVKEKVPSLSRYMGKEGKKLDPLLKKMMAKDREKRLFPCQLLEEIQKISQKMGW